MKEASPTQTFSELKQNLNAVLIDCRTQAEWAMIGLPDLSSIDKHVIAIEWQKIDQTLNPDFISQVSQQVTPNTPVYIMCRSGVRSAAACQALIQLGFTDVTNVVEGFEGRLNQDGHRSKLEGWKFHGLPWRQS